MLTNKTIFECNYCGSSHPQLIVDVDKTKYKKIIFKRCPNCTNDNSQHTILNFIKHRQQGPRREISTYQLPNLFE